MAVQVLVSRKFSVDTVDAVQVSFKSLIDAGWSVLVDVADVNEPQPQPQPQQTVKKTTTAAIIDEIVGKHRITQTEVGRLVGVTQSNLSKYRHGKHSPPGIVLRRLRDLAGQDGPVRQIKPRRRWTVKKLSDEQCLEIAVRKSCGESAVALAGEFGIPQDRVYRIRKELES
jgi:predicted transcriptional regulator